MDVNAIHLFIQFMRPPLDGRTMVIVLLVSRALLHLKWLASACFQTPFT